MSGTAFEHIGDFPQDLYGKTRVVERIVNVAHFPHLVAMLERFFCAHAGKLKAGGTRETPTKQTAGSLAHHQFSRISEREKKNNITSSDYLSSRSLTRNGFISFLSKG